MSGEPGRTLSDVLSKMVLEGVLAELREFRCTCHLLSPVVRSESGTRNFHIRDAAIRFEEAGHRYIIYPGTVMEAVFPISVSGLWSQYFEEFDALAVIRRHFHTWAQRPGSAYYDIITGSRAMGESDAEIVHRIRGMWSDLGALGSAQGTRMHRNIELALGGAQYDASGPEMEMFRRFVTEWLEPKRWQVYRLEWSIYCTAAMVAGQIDAVFVACDGYHMVDWKRCRKPLDVSAGAYFERYGVYPFDDCLDNPCNHYFVQQNLYAVLLERRYGIRLSSMWLVQIHPALESYMVIEVPDMRERAAWILDRYGLGRDKTLPWEVLVV